MGKQGPCYHCGITTTPLWRNGPPDKPVLCNACGSRWRTKGTLVNYMPMHSGGFGVGNEAEKWPRSLKNPNTSRPSAPSSYSKLSRKRKEPSDDTGFSRTGNHLSTSVDEDTCTRSSLGSELSTFDGPSGSAYPVRGTPWDTPVPSKKRTNMFRSRASSERISRNLVSLEEQEVSSVTYPSSDNVLVDTTTTTTSSPLVAVEIGLGGVFIRQPTKNVPEPESEASSLLIENNNRNYDNAELIGQVESKPVDRNQEFPSSRGKDAIRPLIETFPYNKRNVLQSIQSPLASVDLKEIVNFDTFAGLLTDHEQLELIKYLPSADISNCPDSLRSMFSSSQFEAALSNFQLLLSRGMFDSSDANPGLNTRVSHHFQQLLAVTDLTTSGWMEGFSKLKARTKRHVEPKDELLGQDNAMEEKRHQAAFERTGDSKPRDVSMPQRTDLPRDVRFHPPRGKVPKTSVPTGTLKLENRQDGFYKHHQPQQQQFQKNYPKIDQQEHFRAIEEGHDSGGEQDLLLDMPSNMMSFHQAELLPQRSAPRMNNPSHILVEDDDPVPAPDDDNGVDLIMSNTTWQTDWDGGLIWKTSSSNMNATGSLVLPNGTVLNP